MSEIFLQHNVEVSATNISAMFPFPKMDTADAHTLVAENEEIDRNRSCSDGCGCNPKHKEYIDGDSSN